MNFRVEFENDIYADGVYTADIPGYEGAELYWADEKGILSGWTSFGYIKPNVAAGFGVFKYGEGRSVPPGVSHICVKAYRSDSSDCLEKLFPVERRKRCVLNKPFLRFGILTDIHLTQKVSAVKSALQTVKDTDCILSAGDIANSGVSEEFRRFEGCLDEIVSGIPLYSVNGNHDLMGENGQYNDFQRRRVLWQKENGNICYSSFKGVDIIGINAGGFWRKDIMKITREQLVYIDSLLKECKNKQKIILCHTPLSRNMPLRNGRRSSYLSSDAQFQEIIDSYDHIIFLSGHTHLSPGLDSGVVSFDSERANIYINCGSIRPTELGKEADTAPEEWKEGNTVELRISDNGLEILMHTVRSKKLISRGYYLIKF
ncbi:MAG: metallophosphoesterase [Clostridiales bacterium]|nr:metallophosphoesterase [Clostridiales bacterium]